MEELNLSSGSGSRNGNHTFPCPAETGDQREKGQGFFCEAILILASEIIVRFSEYGHFITQEQTEFSVQVSRKQEEDRTNVKNDFLPDLYVSAPPQWVPQGVRRRPGVSRHESSRETA